LLAAIGIYGVLSGSVTERFREIGIRAALGASRVSILALIIRQGMVLTVVGAAAGFAAALLVTKIMNSLLFGVSNLDPLTYVSVLGLLGLVSLAACAAPSWRAAKVDPNVALRYE